MKLKVNWKLVLCLAALSITHNAGADQYSGAADCEAYARNAERQQGSIVGNAAGSAVRGAIFGRIVGGNSKSRRRGAKLGAISGGLRAAARKREAYDRAYNRCMQDAGY